MTGRRLYDRYCDARRNHEPWAMDHKQPAWTYLEHWEKRMWSSMASAISKGKRFA